MLYNAKRYIRAFISKLDLAQAARFVIVGLVNTTFSYLIYALFLFIGLNFALANLGALMFGILFSFRTQGAFVFNNTDSKLLGRFFVVWVAVYLITIAIIGCLVLYGIDPYIGGALALPASAIASFFLQKNLVFK